MVASYESADDPLVEVENLQTHKFSIIYHDISLKFGKHMGPHGVQVYLTLHRMGGVKSEAWPSHKTIADEWGISVSTVRRALDTLSDLGLIKIVPREAKTGGRTSNKYLILPIPPTPLLTHEQTPCSWKNRPPAHP